jgi:hypothetical protein
MQPQAIQRNSPPPPPIVTYLGVERKGEESKLSERREREREEGDCFPKSRESLERCATTGRMGRGRETNKTHFV